MHITATITALAAGLILTGCGGTDSSSDYATVDDLAAALECEQLTPREDTLAAAEAECARPAGTVTLIEYGTPDAGAELAELARGFGVEVEFVTDVLAIAGDRPAVEAATTVLE